MLFLKHSTTILSAFILAATSLLPNIAIAATCGNNQICINEAEDNGQSFYQVINNSSTRIFGFAIYNKGIDALTISTDEDGWSAKTVSSSAWDGRVQLKFDDGDRWITGAYDSTTPSLAEQDHIGTFFQAFSEDMRDGDFGANIYWNNAASTGTSAPLNSGVSLNKFYYSGATLGQSSFVAYDSNGEAIPLLSNLTTGSLTVPDITQPTSPDITVSSVPEPETYLMFLAGLGLLGFISKRKKS